MKVHTGMDMWNARVKECTKLAVEETACIGRLRKNRQNTVSAEVIR